MPRHRKKIIDIASAIILLALGIITIAMWNHIVVSVRSHATAASIYFLPVPQGSSELLVLPDGVTVLTDAGADDGVADDLQKILLSNSGREYIDLAIISYPQAADYGGYLYLLAHYDVGAFLYDGRDDEIHTAQWAHLMNAIALRHIPLITIGAGDRITYGIAGTSERAEIDILSPDEVFAHSPAPSDASIVQRVITSQFTALLPADIGVNVEQALMAHAENLHADILKAPFPGVGTAAGNPFLRAVDPRVIVTMPGAKGSASMPTKSMLSYLASSTAATLVSPKPGQFLLYNK